MKKQKIDEKVIMSHLPSLPDNFSYTVERFSPLVWRIWLNHHYPYDYACSDEGIFLRWNPTKLFIDILGFFGQTYDHKRKYINKSK